MTPEEAADKPTGLWTCPNCARHFGRRNQSHECAPAMSLEEYLSTGPAHERPIVETLLPWLSTLGPLVIEPVSVGILLKHNRSFAELRPMTRWVAVWFAPPQPVDHPRIARRVRGSGGTTWHVVNVAHPDEIDSVLCEWLTAAYLAAG
jgi:hypothetical protein